mgnify:CR=1 FL=1
MRHLTKTQLVNTLKTNAVTKQKLYFTLPHRHHKDGKKHFIFNAQICSHSREYLFSVSEKSIFGQSMNVDKITATTVYLYSFDLLGNEQKAKFPIEQIELTTEDK